MSFSLTVGKMDVMNEVAKQTSYIGAKALDAENDAYNRVFTTDADRALLERYWDEACSAATAVLMPWLSSVETNATIGEEVCYKAVITPSLAYDTALNGSVATSLRSHFITFILSRWLRLTAADQADRNANESAAMLDDVNRKLHYKKAPTRATIDAEHGHDIPENIS